MIPSFICLLINALIYHYVRSSSRRVQAQINSGDNQQLKISRRDIFLLRHMVLMFCIFVGGWAPIYISAFLSYYIAFEIRVFSILIIWCELALLLDMIDLFLYNHELRNYLKHTCLRTFCQ